MAENEKPQMWLPGVYLGDGFCYICGKRAQRYCEICGVLMCLDHWEVLVGKFDYKTVCKHCKNK